MQDFKNFLIERSGEPTHKNTHIEHIEDHILDGEDGFHRSYGSLLHVHNHMNNKHNSNDLTTKIDGSPSIVYGYHPENKKFFVATKSAFNRAPKINHTPEDVDANHGDMKGLADVLKSALVHLPKVTPKGKVYQGDFLFHDGSKRIEPNQVSFQPNTIKYGAKIADKHGSDMAHARFGIATHTQYTGNTISELQATHEVKGLKKHADVYNHPVSHDTSNIDYDEGSKKKFHDLMNKAMDHHIANRQMYQSVQPNKLHVKAYLHHSGREGQKPNAKGLQQFVYDRYAPHIEKLKTIDGKRNAALDRQKHIDYIEKNADAHEAFFQMHQHLTQAKHVLLKNLAKNKGLLDHSTGGAKSGPEGFVVHHDGVPSKLVDRAEFAKANAENSKYGNNKK